MKSSLKIVVATAAIALGFVSVPAMASPESDRAAALAQARAECGCFTPPARVRQAARRAPVRRAPVRQAARRTPAPRVCTTNCGPRPVVAQAQPQVVERIVERQAPIQFVAMNYGDSVQFGNAAITAGPGFDLMQPQTRYESNYTALDLSSQVYNVHGQPVTPANPPVITTQPPAVGNPPVITTNPADLPGGVQGLPSGTSLGGQAGYLPSGNNLAGGQGGGLASGTSLYGNGYSGYYSQSGYDQGLASGTSLNNGFVGNGGQVFVTTQDTVNGNNVFFNNTGNNNGGGLNSGTTLGSGTNNNGTPFLGTNP